MPIKILVVEDEEDIRVFVEKSLAAKGYEVSVASDGGQGWELVQTFKPDVIILDRQMPVMNGMEVLQKIRECEEFKTTPVILLTGQSEDQEIFDGYSYGADFYITKPFNIQSVIMGIERILADEKEFT